MEFFDRKQEVIDIQLTHLGRQLLSTGKWKPKFYAFFDHDVLYDGLHAGITENQKEISDRIKATPRFKLQPSGFGIETHFEKYLSRADDMVESEKQGTWMPPADLTLKLPVRTSYNEEFVNLKAYQHLGNSSLNSSYYPSFLVKFLSGQLSSSFNNYTGSYGGELKPRPVPQINTDVNFYTTIKLDGVAFDSNEEPPSTTFGPEIIEPGLSSEPEEDRMFSPDTYSDGSYVSIQRNNLHLKVVERHIPQSNEYWDLEVFEVHNRVAANGTEYEGLQKMRFIDNEQDEIVNYGNIIYNKNTKETFEIDHTFVEYYFDLTVDKEIEKDLEDPGDSKVILPENPEEPCADE